MAIKNNAKLPDIRTLVQAGIDPRTGLPIKWASGSDCALKDSIKRVLMLNDEQVAINRFKWYNLPDGIDGNLLERILYYKGQLMLFFMPTDSKFYVLPYALDGTVDVYGRFTGVTPLPFAGTAGTRDKDKIDPWITGLKRIPVYSFQTEEITREIYENSCVLLTDYSKQYSDTIIPRQQINDPIIDLESKFFPYLNTALGNATGIQGVRTNSGDEQASIKEASKSVTTAALSGERWVPMLGTLDFQDLTPGQVAKAEEFLLAMEAVDNFRLGTFGLENGGLFQKKAHMLQSEQQANIGNTGLVMNDCLYQRQNFCNIVNSIWGLGIWCEVSENASGNDRDLDGTIEDDTDPMINPNAGGGTDVSMDE